MRMLWLAVLYTTASRVQAYGDSWPDHSFPQIPATPRPIYVVTDIINELGVRILQEYGDTGNVGNVAFSPTGIGFVLVALYEGSAGPGNEQIAHVLGLPRDKDITRIGLRDIHRRLRSYLSPDGFLGGLTLNRENTKLRPEYEDILKFLGFDFPSGDYGNNATGSSTSLPETSAGSNGTEAPESAASTQESTSTLASGITDGVTTTAQITEDVSEPSTASRNPEELTTLKSKGDDDMDATAMVTNTPKATIVVEVTEEISVTEETTVPSTTPIITTVESPATVSEVTARLTEASSAIPTDRDSTVTLSSIQPTTVGASIEVPTTDMSEPDVEAVPENTSPIVDEVMVTMKPVTSTIQPTEQVSSSETTLSAVTEPSTTTESNAVVITEEAETNVEVLDKSESELETQTTSLNSGEGQNELVTTTTEGNSTWKPGETVSNEILYDSTTVRSGTTTANEIDEVETIAASNFTSSESENLLSMNDENVSAETFTTASYLGVELSERRRVRGIEIRDTVVKTLLDRKSAHPEFQVTAKSDLNKSKESKVVWINRVAEYSFTVNNPDYSTTQQTIQQANQDRENGDFRKLTGDDRKNRGTRSPRGYFSNFPEFPSFPVYPHFPGSLEETSWTRKAAGWRDHSPETEEASQDSTELTFLVNGEDATLVPAATYTVVLPFAFLPTLRALALEFPLDDPRYNILLLLPTDRDGTHRLARDLGSIPLREIRKELQPAWVRAMIPSFMLKGFVTLTPFLQRLGIRDVFEPRAADLSPMTEDVGVYARDVQQSIGVNIRNYMKPDRTHSRNGLFERAGPVSFVAEHPFLFFIIDAKTGVSLIAGRIQDPLNSRIL